MKGLSSIHSKLNKQLLTLTLGAGNLNVDETESLGTKARIKKNYRTVHNRCPTRMQRPLRGERELTLGMGRGGGSVREGFQEIGTSGLGLVG